MKARPKFTPKQVEKFKEFVDNGMIEYLVNEDPYDETLNSISEAINEAEEGMYWRREYSHGQAMTALEEIGEAGELLDRIISSMTSEDVDKAAAYMNSKLNKLARFKYVRFVPFETDCKEMLCSMFNMNKHNVCNEEVITKIKSYL